MSVLSLLTQTATIVSGVVSAFVLVGIAVDAVTSGWVRARVQGWLGIRALRKDHHATQTFLCDIGDAYNGLADSVTGTGGIEEDDLDQVDVGQYRRELDDDAAVERGDFLRGGNDD